MTVSSVKPVNSYVGNNSSVTFDFDFLIEASSELVVQHTDSNGKITILQEGVDYSINEISNPNGSYITFPLAGSEYGVLKNDETISLLLDLVIKQESQFNNSLYFDLHILERTFDYIVRILQIFSRKFERCVKIAEGSSTTPEELVEDIFDAKKDSQDALEQAKKQATDAKESAESAAKNAQSTKEYFESSKEYAEKAEQEAQRAKDYADEAKGYIQENVKWGSIGGDINNQNDLKEELDKYYIPNYATEEEAGLVKIGEGINVAEDGTISVVPPGSGFSLFDLVQKDHLLDFEESEGYAQLGTYVYKTSVPGSRYGYGDFYDKCIEEYRNSEIDTDTFTTGSSWTQSVTSDMLTSTSGWTNAENAFDGSDSTYLTVNNTTGYLEVDLKETLYVEGFSAVGNYVNAVSAETNLKIYSVDKEGKETLLGTSTGASQASVYNLTCSFNPVLCNKLRFYAVNSQWLSSYPGRIVEININAKQLAYFIKKHPNGHKYYNYGGYSEEKPIELPTFTSNTQDGITVSDSRNNTTLLQALFNGTNSSNGLGSWSTYWINIKYDIKNYLKSYSITADTSGESEYPTSWDVWGYNDDLPDNPEEGKDYTVIDSRSSVTFSFGEKKIFYIARNVSYKNYRIVFKTGKSNSNGGELKQVTFNAITVSGSLVSYETDKIYEQTGVAWYYGIDEENERIFLPRNDYIANFNGEDISENGENKKCYVYMVVGNGKVTKAQSEVTEVTTSENDTLPMFTGMYFDFKPNHVSWLKAGTQANGNIYTSAYNTLVSCLTTSENIYNIPVVEETKMQSDVDYSEYWKVNQDEMTFTAPLKTSLLNTISNARILIEKKEATEEDSSWYNLYSDGWIEQGGRAYVNNNSTSVVTLPKEMINTDYYVNLTHITTSIPSNADVAVGDLTTSSFKIYAYTGASNKPWEVKGYTTPPALEQIADSENIGLYFKVGNAVENLELINAGTVMEKFNDLVEVQCVIESYENGSAGYTIDSNDRLIQWGRTKRAETGTVEIPLLKEFANTDYIVFAVNRALESYASASSFYAPYVLNVSTIKFSLSSTASVSNIGYFDWIAIGKVKNG